MKKSSSSHLTKNRNKVAEDVRCQLKVGNGQRVETKQSFPTPVILRWPAEFLIQTGWFLPTLQTLFPPRSLWKPVLHGPHQPSAYSWVQLIGSTHRISETKKERLQYVFPAPFCGATVDSGCVPLPKTSLPSGSSLWA